MGTDGHTDNEANSRFYKFGERVIKTNSIQTLKFTNNALRK